MAFTSCLENSGDYKIHLVSEQMRAATGSELHVDAAMCKEYFTVFILFAVYNNNTNNF
jgi:hypothetical protein